jgi:hypothetical protein
MLPSGLQLILSRASLMTQALMKAVLASGELRRASGTLMTDGAVSVLLIGQSSHQLLR